MNWYIFAIVVCPCFVALVAWTAYELGKKQAGQFVAMVNVTRLKAEQQTAYNNGHRKGFEAGVSHWKRIVAERAREAARRDGKGRFAKGPGSERNCNN